MKQVISAAVTPFTDDGRLDLSSASKLYEVGIGHGLDGFFILGSMGEWALLTPEEKEQLAQTACDTIGNRAKILLGISDTGLPGILRNMERLSSLSHTHWVVVLPSGIGAPVDPVKYLHQLADAADRLLYFYYLPQVNNVVINTEQFRDIFAHPRIVGVKNSAGSIRVRRELLKLKQEMDFELYEGEEWGIDEALALGCDGAVAGFGSCGGKLIKSIVHEVDSGNLDVAAELQYQLIGLFHEIYGGAAAPYWSVGQKYALQYMGIISSPTSRVASQQDLPESAKARIRTCIDANREYLL